jgi:hypothetical protein
MLSHGDTNNRSKLVYGRGSSILPFKRLIRNSQEYFDFPRFSRGRRRQGVEVFEETSPRKTGGAKVPFDNFDPEDYFGDAGLRNPATRCASPVTGVQGVENALRGDFDPMLKRRQSTLASGFRACMRLTPSVMFWRSAFCVDEEKVEIGWPQLVPELV